MEFCREIGALYIDTVVEPWPGFYFDPKLGTGGALELRAARDRAGARAASNPGGATAVSCCGANPGMVSWFVKQALLDVATRPRRSSSRNRRRARNGASSPRRLGVKGIHIAERDTQRAKQPKPHDVFVNTWSVEGFLSEGMQPAELGWGTHEKWMPDNGAPAQGRLRRRDLPDPARRQHARALMDADAAGAIRLPRHPQRVDLDRRLISRCASGRKTCDLPADLPLRLSPLQRRRAVAARDVRPRRRDAGRASTFSTSTRSSTASTSSACCSTATPRTPIGTARSFRSRRRARLAPYQNATGLQVTSRRARRHGVGAGKSRTRHRRGRRDGFPPLPRSPAPYLGPVIGAYTDWTPLTGRPGLFPEDIDTRDPWQFRTCWCAEIEGT